ncbi:hypothetical protein BKG77_13255 [Mycobacteroides chelonae]|uniref:hypothetical protein n=1 Tax=Mycobacteroides chelonae TaxID=1774 RepID=UPI0008A83DBF|nr:hypothetical protein [Mycobacteroides chelonae]OHU24455.1 hypothetical protein BKG77_13255 [Mycobacteroides chelonae]
MITRSIWEVMQAVRVAVLICFLPVVLYRIWRLIRYRTSIPAVAVTAFGASAWLWLLAFTDSVWNVLPQIVRAVSMGGWPAITIAACLQVFVVGISGDASPDRVRRGLRITFAMATLALVVVTLTVRNSSVLMTTYDALTISNIVYSGGDRASAIATIVTSGYVISVVLQMMWVGFRHADRTPVGVGLGLLATASAFQVVGSLCGGVWRPLAHGEGFIGSPVGLWFQTLPGCVAAILMVAGFLWAPVVSHVQARRDMKRLRPLHSMLADMFRGLFPPTESHIRLSDKVFEWSTHIQDGLTLLAQSRGVPLDSSAMVPEEEAARALAVSNWILGQSSAGFSCAWLRPPVDVSDQAWVLAIADAYRNCMETSEVQEVGRERLPVGG